MKPVLGIVAIAVFALAVFPTAAAAQAVDRDRERAENERDLDLRSWNLRILSLQYNKNKSRSRPNPQQALEQLQQDFLRLQAVNNNLLRTALKARRLTLDLFRNRFPRLRSVPSVSIKTWPCPNQKDLLWRKPARPWRISRT